MNAARLKNPLTLAMLGTICIASAAEPPRSSAEVSIPFMGHMAINDWQPDGRQGLWIQDEHYRWYYARLNGPCLGLDHALAIAFDTRPGGPFDRFSSIIVPNEDRCHLQSLVRSDPPPKKAKSTGAKKKS